MNDLVSIIMPSHNCGEFVEEAIRSVLAQTYQNWELLFVDDNSQDNTLDIVKAIAKDDARIRIFENKEKLGAAISRNIALQEAKGRWIAFLDSDDIWEPQKLERQVDFMEKNGYAFSYHEYIEIDEKSNELGVLVSGKKCVGKWGMYSCCWPGCLTVMYDANIVGLIQIKDIKRNNDTAIWLKAIRKADCYLLKECLAKYRKRNNSITPEKIWQRILAHYPLFRVAEEMNPVLSVFWVIVNIFGNAYKKMRYVRRYNSETEQ